MGTCKIWLAFEERASSKIYRKVFDGYPCEIHGVTMVVHKVPIMDKPRWRVSDPFTGYNVTGFIGTTRKDAIDKIRKYADDLEIKEGKPFKELMEAKRKTHGNVMNLPEGGPSGTKKSMSA